MSNQYLIAVKNKHHSVHAIMYQVILGLIPGIAVMVWLFGISVLLQISLAIITAVFFESLILFLRKRKIFCHSLDGSAILTAILLAISIPSMAPWWLIIIGTFFAIVFGKQLYGGLGNNIFNPAMVGFVVLMVSFPKEMTIWPAIDFYQNLSFSDQWGMIFNGISIDDISEATPLNHLHTNTAQGFNVLQSFPAESLGWLGIKSWEYINLAFLLGGLFLLLRGLITLVIPMSIIISLALSSFIANLVNPEIYPLFNIQLFTGATMLAAFFIATDPVSASITFRGKIIYGVGIGVLVFLIRSFGSFHDSFAFAILLMNMCVPLIDNYTLPKMFGKNNG